MKKTIRQIKEIVSEAVAASTQHFQKELIRQELQNMIVDRVKEGKITDQSSLEEFFSTVDMAEKALKNIPFEIYLKISKS